MVVYLLARIKLNRELYAYVYKFSTIKIRIIIAYRFQLVMLYDYK